MRRGFRLGLDRAEIREGGSPLGCGGILVLRTGSKRIVRVGAGSVRRSIIAASPPTCDCLEEPIRKIPQRLSPNPKERLTGAWCSIGA